MRQALLGFAIYAGITAAMFFGIWAFTSFAWWEMQDISAWRPERRGMALGFSMCLALAFMAPISFMLEEAETKRRKRERNSPPA